MEYRFIRSTLRYREGDTVEMDPDHPWTQQRLERGIVEPVKKRRRKKPTDGMETKHDSQDD